MSNTNTAVLDKPAKSDRGGKYLTFALGKEEYGLEILKVREIMGLMDITAVPRTPSYVKGVINLRGQVITVIDLRAKFGMPTVEKTDQTCIIVVEIESSGRKLSTGIIVDRVSEVQNIAAEKIEDAPSLGTKEDEDFILGMGKIGDSVKILLDIDKVLSTNDITQLTEAANQ
ncbi:MAG TPA: chemotaxis protein CheW [Tepidisphaeraceae bacterium]|nr:chemotaxis protein CheW [Tepidisphaeraceae bacterium]